MTTSVDVEAGVIIGAGAEYANLSDQADFVERVDKATAALEDRGLSPTVVADKGHPDLPYRADVDSTVQFRQDASLLQGEGEGLQGMFAFWCMHEEQDGTQR